MSHWIRRQFAKVLRAPRARRKLFTPRLQLLEQRLVLASDFGDAPTPYPTLLVENGAQHTTGGALKLGATVDSEANGTHSANADADGADEDGVTFGTIMVGALGATVTVNVTGATGKLDAWIDFNGDGSWGGPGEQIFASEDVGIGTNNLTFDVPSWAKDGVTFARFRLSTAGGLGTEGLSADGEVEDYAVTVIPPAAASGVFGGQNIVSTSADGANSVFAADMDGDGDMDMLSASYSNDTIAWYENDGSQIFIAHTISSAANGARTVFAADVDSDGDTDVLSASSIDDKIAWYENDGNQNFTARTISTTASGAFSVFAADIDGDGDTDVLSASYSNDTIAWYENDGNQNFTTHTISTVANFAASVFAADVDGDGDLDVLSASTFDDKIAWYENDGSQNFTPHTISTAADGAYSVFAADLDGDGDTDVLSASGFDHKIAWYENDGSQNFTAHTISTSDAAPVSVFAADVNGDGDLDVLIASLAGNKIAWYENDGSQDFTAHTIATAAISAASVFAADVDRDGDLDVLSASQNDDKIAWYENLDSDYGDAPVPYATTDAENGARHKAVGPTLGASRDADANGTHSANADADGADDDGVTFGTIRVGQLSATATVVVTGGAGKLDAWIDFNGDGSWGGPGEQIFASQNVVVGTNNLTFDVPSWAKDGVTFARFRLSTAGGLGTEGLAADGEVEDYAVTVIPPAVASGVFGGQNIVSTGADNVRSVFAADVDGDGDMDMLSASFVDNKVAWYENDGSQNFTAHTISTATVWPFSVFAADMDGDGDTDVLSASGYDDKITWYENDGSQHFTAHTISTAADAPRSVFAADVDGDGDTDVLSASSNDDKISWYENDGSQNFTAHTISIAADGAISVFAADVDGDGDTDVLSASPYDDRIAWYENDGSQNFATHTISTAADSAYSVFAADVDGDGDTDVLSASSNDDKIAWYENDGSQNFTPHTISTAADNPRSVFAADVDGDGDTDVLSASVVENKIAWYENDGSQNFTPHTISTAAIFAVSVFAADVDGDGDLDVLSASSADDKIAWYENLSIQPNVSLVLTGSPLAENGGAAIVRATLDITSSQNVTVNLGFTGSATLNTDYSPSSNSIVILAGQTSGSITLTGINDITFEGNESIVVDVTSVTNGTENGTQSVTATIADDETQPTVSIVFPTAPQLVRDIVSGSGSSPTNFVNVGGTAFFTATTVGEGTELWKSDGTSAGTVLVKDINPGASYAYPLTLTNVNGTLYFVATDGTNGYELWKSDGTSAGTVLVRDIRSGVSSASPQSLTNVNGTLYFSANDGTNGFELWKSDGTSAGTVLVRDIRSGVSSASPLYLTNVNGTLYFSANDGTNGYELWKSDGSSAGTVLVKDIRPGVTGAVSGFLTNVNGTLYFRVNDGTNGYELWKSDGTSAGTVLIKDIRPGVSSATPRYLTNVNGTLYFSASDGTNGYELWKSDGTSAGTVLVRDINPGASFARPRNLTNVNGTLYFRADDGTNGYELWKSDGSSAGTVLVRDVLSGATGSNPRELTNVNGTLYFSAVDFTNGDELWKSDGTSAGTVLVRDIRPGANGAGPGSLTNVNGTLYFQANDGTNGRELWALLPPNAALAENGGTVTIQASLSNPSTQNVTVNLGFAGTATSNTDYSANSNTIVILAGQTSGSITLTGINDFTNEGNESIIVGVTSVTNGTENGTQSVTASITDDDAQPSVSLALSGSPLAENGGIATVRATLSNPSTQNVTVNLGFTGTATNNTDYSASSNAIVILAGQTSGSITLTGINDFTNEGNESIVVDVTSVTNGTENGTQSVTATITDDDAQPSVSLALSGSPLAENGGIATVRATLSNPSTQNVTVTLGFTGTATNNTDYSAGSNTIVILAGQTSGSITLTGINDTTNEGNESIIVDVTGVTNGTENGTQSVTATITDDDGQPSVSLALSGSPLAENGGIATVRATLSNPSTQNVTVTLGFTGTATNNSDYSASSNTIVILAGQTSGSITLTGINDATNEGNESIIVDVTSVTNGTENGTQSVTATITDDDGQPSVSLALSGSPLAENGGNATVRATLSNPSTQNVTVTLGFTSTATNNSDYSASSNTIVILAGQTSGSITLTGINDATNEGNESIVVDVTGVTNGTENGTQSVTATITDDDGQPSVSLALIGSPLAENGGLATVRATLSNPSTQDLTVTLGFTGTATNNSDYSASSNTIVILAGQTSGSITLTGINDLTNEGNESIVVDVTGVTNGTENGTQSVTATITDDDAQPSVSLALSGSPLAENGGIATVRATLSNPSMQNVTVNLGFAGTATNNSDYSASSNTIVILAGQTSGSITLTGINDATNEGNESIVVNVTGVTNGTESGTQSVTATITDNDAQPSVSLALSGSPLAENGGNATVRATLSNPSTQNVTVNLGFTGTATNNTDYSASSNTIVILAGQTSGSITLTGINDATNEGNESIVVDVTGVTNGTENGTQSVTATITDDDAQPSVSLALSGSPLVENGGIATVRATLSNPSTQNVTVSLGLTGTATNNTDYAASSNAIVILAGQTSGSITLTGINDATNEGNESIVVDVTGVTNGTENGTQSVTATITDNDAQPSVSLALSGSPLAENGGIATVRATLSNPSTQNVTVSLGLTGTATNNTDYSASSNTIVILAGQTSGSITLTGINDFTNEGNESIVVDVTGVTNGTENGTQSVTATITDDDAQPSVSLALSGSPLVENGGIATVRATLSNPSTQNVTVSLGFTGSATNNTDYSASSNTIVILAGQTSGSITLTGINDFTNEGNESIVVDVTGVTNGSENGTQSVTATITDDDAQPSVSLALSGSPLAENGGIATVRATLSNPSTQNVTVSLGLTGTATNNTDYSASSNTIVILAGQTSGSITLTGINDLTNEGNESIVVDVTGVTNGTESGTQSVTATITDNDAQPSVSLALSGSPLAENGGIATVRATLSNPSTQNVTVNLGFTGSATNNTDYSASSNTIVILAGQTSGSITLTGINDNVSENVESIVVDITSATGATENGVQQVTARIGNILPAVQSANTPGGVVDLDRYSVSGSTLTIHGTLGDDSIGLMRTGVNGFYTYFDGELVVFSTVTINQVIIVSNTGQDTFSPTLADAVIETAALGYKSLTVTSTNLTLQSDAEVNVPTGQINDSATINDSTGNDLLYLLPSYAFMWNPSVGDYINWPVGFGSVTAAASTGTDILLFYGDAGPQTFAMNATQSSLTTGGRTLTANNFEQQFAYGTPGDIANLTGTAGNDIFYRIDPYMILVAGSGWQEAIGFPEVNVISGGGDDAAVFYDSTGDDTFTGSPTRSTFQTSVDLARVNNFRNVYAFASTGNDTATLSGSSGNDTFYGGQAVSTLSSAAPAYVLQARGFDLVHANLSLGTTGNDLAFLDDAAGIDSLTAQSNFAELLYSAGNRVRVTAFDTVYARGTAGGINQRTVTNPLLYSLIFSGSWAP